MAKTKYTYGFTDKPRGGPLSIGEAKFAAKKRAQGVPEIQIARMLGCTLDVLTRGVVVDEGYASAPDPQTSRREARERAEWENERRERNRIARGMTTWRAGQPDPLSAEASFPPELRVRSDRKGTA